MTERIQKFIADKARLLTDAGIERARGEIEIILCHLLDCERLDIYLHGYDMVTDDTRARLNEIIKRRLSREPLQYILGESWFYGRRFRVSPAVMVPTPETELLCETAIRCVLQRGVRHPHILDLGVGSGVISVTMALELPECEVVALDISEEAIEVARTNAAELGAVDKIEFRQSDSFEAIPETERYDLILSNPPYIANWEYDALPPEVKADPTISLLAGDDGLDAVRVILRDAPKFLAPSGRILFEIGYDQGDRVVEMTEADEHFRSIVVMKDYNDQDRVVMLSCD
ncbi:MAG: peptide chain release factor N(5)-glutamine methyltransferase [candidate division Zixibacteria bacterium]|nr:peptide chain release factor N(5)-glutamine methyltransferase [candidate division Zixibacteria bacterium]